MKPPKGISSQVAWYSQAAITLPLWTATVLELVTASAAPWHFPEQKPGGDVKDSQS